MLPPRAAALSQALAAGPVVLDGGLSTRLEAMGYDLSGDLWSAVLLRDAPDAVRAAHAAFAAAGARVATTASYQATFEGFAAAGIGRAQAQALLRRSVTLAREAVGDDGWVAGSVGPYGAFLAGGEEYTGAYVDPAWSGRAGGGLSVAELTAWHLPRMAALAGAGADVLACETVPAAAEAQALVAALDDLGVPGWLALTTVTGADGVARTRRGEDAAAVFGLARGVEAVVAVGVNCVDPAGVPAALGAASAAGKPVVVYPNSGETWDGPARVWRGAPGFAAHDVVGWVAAGARLVGGCCRVGPAEVAAITAALTGRPGPRRSG